uniref:Uncharacterized protein n=1 Tax=Rhizophagus irregularis (strain DAOM 181602 / DAOM 197198 / MUCL 43194) TaxID=747089 RepID=U9U6V6_RHIID
MSRGCLQLAAVGRRRNKIQNCKRMMTNFISTRKFIYQICWKYYSMISSKMVSQSDYAFKETDEEGLSKAIADSINKEGPNGVWIIPSRKRILEKLTKDAVVDMKYFRKVVELVRRLRDNDDVQKKQIDLDSGTIDWLNDKEQETGEEEFREHTKVYEESHETSQSSD